MELIFHINRNQPLPSKQHTVLHCIVFVCFLFGFLFLCLSVRLFVCFLLHSLLCLIRALALHAQNKIRPDLEHDPEHAENQDLVSILVKLMIESEKIQHGIAVSIHTGRRADAIHAVVALQRQAFEESDRHAHKAVAEVG